MSIMSSRLITVMIHDLTCDASDTDTDTDRHNMIACCYHCDLDVARRLNPESNRVALHGPFDGCPD